MQINLNDTYINKDSMVKENRRKLKGNISGANQPLRANYENFNLGHQINIQGEGRREVGGRICKSVITQSKGGSRL